MSSQNNFIRQGDIYLVDLEPTQDGEANKTRPAVILSNNANNNFAPTVTVVPITTNTKSLYPFQVFLAHEDTGLDYDSKAQAEQVRTISKKRLRQYIGILEKAYILEIKKALGLHFGIDD